MDISDLVTVCEYYCVVKNEKAIGITPVDKSIKFDMSILSWVEQNGDCEFHASPPLYKNPRPMKLKHIMRMFKLFYTSDYDDTLWITAIALPWKRPDLDIIKNAEYIVECGQIYDNIKMFVFEHKTASPPIECMIPKHWIDICLIPQEIVWSKTGYLPREITVEFQEKVWSKTVYFPREITGEIQEKIVVADHKHKIQETEQLLDEYQKKVDKMKKDIEDYENRRIPELVKELEELTRTDPVEKSKN